MRPASELRRLAIATGTFDDYQGDGASVPWQYVIPPLNAVLFFYKRYLDRRWPAAFKMHDWLYTPYGQLIQATKDEADAALREEIAVDSPRDAAIVFRAVQLGPAYWFGNSMTGFPNRIGHNIEVESKEFHMPTKVVVQFKALVGQQNPAKSRIGGWSEFVWSPSDDIPTILFTLRQNVAGLLPNRAAMLPATATISGVKLYQGGAGRGNSQKMSYPGNANWPTDVPQMAVQLAARSLTTGGVRNFHIKGIPDQFVVQGIFQPNAEFTTALNMYFLALTNFGFYTKPTSSIKYDLNTVVAIPPVAPATDFSGLVTTVKPVTFNVGDQVQFFSTVLANGQKYTVTKRVTSVASAIQFTVSNWTAGNTTAGKVGSPTKVFDLFSLGNIETGAISTIKIGRPSDQYRGKRSKRRKVA